MTSTTSSNGRVEHAADAARDAFNTTRESFSDASEAVRKAARVGAKEAAAYGRDSADRAYAVAQDASRSVSAYIRARPVEAALIGIGGLVIASLLLRRR